TVLELRVASADMGRVIGKSGRVINAIRDLVQVQAAKLGQNIVLDIVED
ncbi:MAG: KH domain-containing protein, partial [Anaerolineales bacterium]|nr:KH domain-containing protein [Anaerolineales bacterium]